MVFHSTFIGDCFAQFKVFILNLFALEITPTFTQNVWKPEEGGGGPSSKCEFKIQLSLYHL